MTKEVLIELLNRRFGNKHHPELISANISRAWNQILKQTYRDNPDELDACAKEYFIETGDLLTDTNTSIVYFLLPASSVLLPYNEHIRDVRPKQDTENVYHRVSISERSVLNGLDFDSITERGTTYIIKGSKIELEELSAAHKAAGIILVMVVSFDEYDDTDEIYIPGGMDQTLIQLVGEFLEGKPQDILIDNNQDNQT